MDMDSSVEKAISEISFADSVSYQQLAKILVLGSIFFLMLAISVLKICLLLAVLCSLLAGQWRQKLQILLKNPVVILGLILVLLLTIGIFYSEASWGSAFNVWNKYLKILYLVFFLPLFLEPRSRRLALYALIAGVIISEGFTYLHHFHIMEFGISEREHWLFVNDIDASFVVAYVCYVLANFIVDAKKYRWLFTVVFVFCCFDLLFLNQERTGYLVFLSLVVVFLWQRLSWKGLLSAIILVPLVAAGLYLSSDKFHARIGQIFENINDYQQGHETTSIGLRLAFAKYSFKIIKEHPIFGAGTGSFEKLYQVLSGPKLDEKTWPTHPHNEYILMLLQIGIVGLFVFLAWAVAQFLQSQRLLKFERSLLQGLIIGFLVLSFCNASLLVRPAGLLYVLLLAVLLSAEYGPHANKNMVTAIR
jgi:O-antigen ligase